MNSVSPHEGLLHDLNNLLTAIAGVADAVLERPTLDRESRADIESIREGALRGTTLGRFAGASFPARPDPISLNATVRAILPLLTRHLGNGLSLSLSLDSNDSLVAIEAGALDRVLLNLVTNARHATRTGGTIALRTSTRTVTAPEVRLPDTIPPGNYAVASVADTGTGISPTHLPLIFEPGFTTKQSGGGSGLGLASVRSILNAHAGYVRIESTEGLGTCIDLYLPRVAPDVPAPDVPAPDVPVSGRQVSDGGESNGPMSDCPVSDGRQPDDPAAGAARTVLLVDDDPLVRNLTERVLRRAGWQTLSAASAAEALAILDRDRCGLMISDVSMPGMDGLALSESARARCPDLPVILTSGYPRVPEGAAGGPVLFLSKPYASADLLRLVVKAARRGTEAMERT